MRHRFAALLGIFVVAMAVGSMVSEVSQRGAVCWVTATAAPCISIFKPVMLDVPLPPQGAAPTDRFDGQSGRMV